MDRRNRIINQPALLALNTYKKVVSPFLFMTLGGACRFQPTCSEYAHESIKKHGILKGSLLSSYRVLRCNPLNKGGHDPV